MIYLDYISMQQLVDSSLVNMKRGSGSWDIPQEAFAVRNIPQLQTTEYDYIYVAVRGQ